MICVGYYVGHALSFVFGVIGILSALLAQALDFVADTCADASQFFYPED